MSKRKTTKRRKVWVNEYEHELGSIAWHTVREATNMEKEDVTGTVAFIEREYPLHYRRLLALLRGGR